MTRLEALRSSVMHLRGIVDPLMPDQLDLPAYPAQWTVADVLSHIGSGAVILQRRLAESLAADEGAAGDDQAVWDEWDAKTPDQKAADALVADAALLDALDQLDDEQRSGFSFSMGPMSFDFDEYVGLRLNEHTLHTWDIESVFVPDAALWPDAVPHVIDSLGLITRFTGRPTGTDHTVLVRTSEPARDLAIVFDGDTVEMRSGDATAAADLDMPAEALIRLVYGRLDPDHTPIPENPRLDELRGVFPGA
jgi:uncharacterized protein (TIGR03083 family)